MIFNGFRATVYFGVNWIQSFRQDIIPLHVATME